MIINSGFVTDSFICKAVYNWKSLEDTDLLKWLLPLTAVLLNLKDAYRTEVRFKSLFFSSFPFLLPSLLWEKYQYSYKKMTGRQSKYIISLLSVTWTCENPEPLLLLFHFIITCTWRYILGHYWLHWSWNQDITQSSIYKMYIPLFCSLASSYLQLPSA